METSYIRFCKGHLSLHKIRADSFKSGLFAAGPWEVLISIASEMESASYDFIFGKISIHKSLLDRLLLILISENLIVECINNQEKRYKLSESGKSFLNKCIVGNFRNEGLIVVD